MHLRLRLINKLYDKRSTKYTIANTYLAVMSLKDPEQNLLEQPPLLGSWPRMYTVVLVLHVILIVLFYLFSNAYA